MYNNKKTLHIYGQSFYLFLVIKGDIVSHILKTRDSEIEERKKKRKEEKKVKEEEEEKKKKEKKEKETEPSEPLPVIFTPPFLQQVVFFLRISIN